MTYFMVRLTANGTYLGRRNLTDKLGPVPRQFGSTFINKAEAIKLADVIGMTDVVLVKGAHETVVWESGSSDLHRPETGEGRY